MPADSENEWVAGNQIPVFLHKISGIAIGQTLQVARKKCIAVDCFVILKKKMILERDHFFVAVLSEMDLDKVDVFVWITTKYV